LPSSSFRFPCHLRLVSIEPGPSWLGCRPDDRVTGPEPCREAMLGRRRPGSHPLARRSA